MTILEYKMTQTSSFVSQASYSRNGSGPLVRTTILRKKSSNSETDLMGLESRREHRNSLSENRKNLIKAAIEVAENEGMKGL